MRALRWALLVLIAAGGFALGIVNTQSVQIELYLTRFEAPLALLLGLTLLSGVLAGGLVAALNRGRQ